MTSVALSRPASNVRSAAKLRQFVTPEGVDLQLEIASSGLRFAALLVDLLLMLIILIVATLVLGAGGGPAMGNQLPIIWLLGFFALRNFWFILFELGPRAATPGKRLCGIRVVARDGGRLDVASVVARNFVREVEMFLPLSFIFGGGSEAGSVDWTLAITGLFWTLAMSLFLLFNKDRMRLGDLIGGTWVVLAQRRKMAADLSAPTMGDTDRLTFSAAELAVYGVFELQELERVLRERDAGVMAKVADTIRAKLGRPANEYDEEFLSAYYRQLKVRMERDLLFGKRRANKYESG